MVVSFGDTRLPETFWNRVEQSGAGCWTWNGAQKGKGYSNIWFRGRHNYGHRVSYETLVGSIPDGDVIDHLCRNRLCVNPDHLEPVSNRENLSRSPLVSDSSRKNAEKASESRRNQTHCKRGHEFVPNNTGIRANGHRWCRECQRVSDRTRYAKNKI